MTRLRDGDRVRDGLGRIGSVLHATEAEIEVQWDDSAPRRHRYAAGACSDIERVGDAHEGVA